MGLFQILKNGRHFLILFQFLESFNDMKNCIPCACYYIPLTRGASSGMCDSVFVVMFAAH